MRSSIFGSKSCILTRSTAECFRDKLPILNSPIFTLATSTYNYPVNRFISDTNKSTASLKVLESLSEECKLPASCRLMSQPKYHHVFVLDRTKKCEKSNFLSAVNARGGPRFHRRFHFPFKVHSTRKDVPDKRRKHCFDRICFAKETKHPREYSIAYSNTRDICA